MNKVFRSFLLMAAVMIVCVTGLNAQRAIFVEESFADEDFNLSNSELPSWEIIQGGPGKDGIPALTDPDFTTARSDKWLTEEDLVIGVTLNGVTKAYPIRVLNYHEIINDDFKGERVAITYSPLCGSAMAYRTETHEQTWELAVSGLLYNNNALYFDRETESLWSQSLGRAVAGPVAGAQLDLLPTTLTTWGEWQERYPATLLLAEETGYTRNYDVDAYAYYGTTDRLMFPMNHSDDRLQLKERIVGVQIDGVYKAYPYKTLEKAENHITLDMVNGQEISIEFVPVAQAAYVTDLEGNPLPSASMYWFSWSATHPDTEIYSIPEGGAPTSLSMSIGD
ncbi:DUF3179 domain-containing protein [Lewinella sp. LCG006]|uniref:DUF3179 domain-containing protein n=1 Tax=Lewinella sp. LCG006 TaxID=3231911 RepID=UPI00345F2B36